ncbi:MAG: O-antigen ligase family protein [Opitutaceae bacterium]
MITKLIILAGGAIILALLLARKYRLLCWVLLFTMVIGPRRAQFVYQDIVREINWKFEVIPFTVLLLLLLLLTVRFIRFTLGRWDLVALALIAFSFVVAMASGVPFDKAVLWMVPISSVFLTKHVIMVFVRNGAAYETATRIFLLVSFLIAAGSLMTAVGITFGGFLLPSQAYGVIVDGKVQAVTRAEGFWGTATVAGVTVTSILLLPTLRAPSLIKLGLAGAQVASVMVSGKRLAFLSMALTCLFLIVGSKGRYRKVTGIGLAAIIAVVAWIYLPSTGIIERFGEAEQALSGERENDQRIRRFSYAIDSYLTNPILGGGAGNVAYIHNGYLELLANMGLAALPVIAALLLPIWTGYRAGGATRVWAQIAGIFMVSPFMLEAVLNRPEHLTFLGFFLGMIQATHFLERRPVRIPTRGPTTDDRPEVPELKEETHAS